MDESIILRLSQWLAHEPVVLASVIDARGATPRRVGARMLISPTQTAYSIGGGLAEARVIGAARTMLQTSIHQTENIVEISLQGGIDAAGVCGGHMRIAMRVWAGAQALAQASVLSHTLARGERVALELACEGHLTHTQTLLPNPRLLVIGGGHCGAALLQLAAFLDFDLHAYDVRTHCLLDEMIETKMFETAAIDSEARESGSRIMRWTGDVGVLRAACQTKRPLAIALLNRDFPADVEALRVLSECRFDYLGLMGSARRIHEVKRALHDAALDWHRIQTPIGVDIQAESPHEIAISVLAQIIQWRRHSNLV